MLVFVLHESVADMVVGVHASQFMPAEAERRASSATGVQESISPQETGQVLTLRAIPVRNPPIQIRLKSDAHDDCTSSRQGFGRKEDRTYRLRAAAQHRTRRRGVRFARLILEV